MFLLLHCFNSSVILGIFNWLKREARYGRFFTWNVIKVIFVTWEFTCFLFVKCETAHLIPEKRDFHLFLWNGIDSVDQVEIKLIKSCYFNQMLQMLLIWLEVLIFLIILSFFFYIFYHITMTMSLVWQYHFSFCETWKSHFYFREMWNDHIFSCETWLRTPLYHPLNRTLIELSS